MSDAPKPTTGYLVVNPDWDPARTPAEGWTPLPTEKAALAGVGAEKVILKAVTTYTLVEGGGRA